MKKVIVDGKECYIDDPVHLWFELTYASYLVLHRSAMCAMPIEWQEKMVALLDEMEDTIDADKMPQNFTINVRDERGKFIKDPYSDYRRGPKVPMRNKEAKHGEV